MGAARVLVKGCADALASTRGVVFVLSVLMMLMTISTAENYRLDELPFRGLLLVMSATASVVGFAVVWVGPTTRTRQWVGGITMVYAAIRAFSFTWQVGARTVGLWGFLREANPVWSWMFAWFLGFLVWRRAHGAPHGGSRGEA